MKAKTKVDICKDILKDDVVEIVPEYGYMLGDNTRVKEYFDVKPGEVVIKKVDPKSDKEEITIIKCKRKDLEIMEKTNN